MRSHALHSSDRCCPFKRHAFWYICTAPGVAVRSPGVYYLVGKCGTVCSVLVLTRRREYLQRLNITMLTDERGVAMGQHNSVRKHYLMVSFHVYKTGGSTVATGVPGVLVLLLKLLRPMRNAHLTLTTEAIDQTFVALNMVQSILVHSENKQTRAEIEVSHFGENML